MTRGRMPAVFIGHGNPMNALEHNAYTEAWANLAEQIPRPRAILAVSAHWNVPGGRVTAEAQPKTIHDFGGFPQELFDVQYPAPGSPDLATRTRTLLEPAQIAEDRGWGLDHGTWSVLVHLYPDADVPVVQLGIDETLTAAQHYDLATRLRPLRDEGVLILGSGNVVHNLHTYSWARHPIEPYDWAVRFESSVRSLVDAHDHGPIVRYERDLPDGALAAPTPDHFLPLIYTLAQREGDDTVGWKVGGFDGGSVSMLALQLA
jgi:4,5-DOPA dioxygenase extradiol